MACSWQIRLNIVPTGWAISSAMTWNDPISGWPARSERLAIPVVDDLSIKKDPLGRHPVKNKSRRPPRRSLPTATPSTGLGVRMDRTTRSATRFSARRPGPPRGCGSIRPLRGTAARLVHVGLRARRGPSWSLPCPRARGQSRIGPDFESRPTRSWTFCAWAPAGSTAPASPPSKRTGPARTPRLRESN